MRPSGDHELEHFIETHHQRLVGLLVLRCGGDQAAAHDLAQDALIKLVEHWDRDGGIERPWPWLATVAVNLSTNRWRRIATALRVERTLRPAQFAEASEGTTELLQVIAALPCRQREAVLLRHYAQLSVAESASAMGCAEGTVKALTSQGLAALRRQLDFSEETHHAHDR